LLGVRVLLQFVAYAALTAAGCATPTTPTTTALLGKGLALACSASTILAGDLVVCEATASSTNVSTSATWASSDSNVVTSKGFGVFMGKSDGQATLTATYSGSSVSVPVVVQLQDVIRATASAYQGTFKVGTTATMWLQGFYGVASLDFGTLTLVITDQDGATISSSAPLTVSHGGDRYLLSSTFTIPSNATRVCRTGVLQIGSTTLTVVPGISLVPCLDVTP